MTITIIATDEADLVRQLLPRFHFGEDNDGQLVLYTNHLFSHAGAVVPFEVPA